MALEDDTRLNSTGYTGKKKSTRVPGDSTQENKRRHIVNVAGINSSPLNFGSLYTVHVSDIFIATFAPLVHHKYTEPNDNAYVKLVPIFHIWFTTNSCSTGNTDHTNDGKNKKNKIIMEDIKAKKLEMTSSKELFSMRDNLMFYGLPKQENDENCDQMMKEMIQSKLGIKSNNIMFDKIYRTGSDKARKPRHIAA